MRIQLYEDPLQGALPKEDVRFNELGLFVYDDGRRVAVGFDITPFLERPSIQVLVTNEVGQEAASLSIIEAMQANFNLTLHLRDDPQTANYSIEAQLYYISPDGERLVVDKVTRTFDSSVPGEQ